VRIIRTVAEVRNVRPATGSVALIPTMGALHAGHLSLFEAARAECDTVVASIFVNEAQFGSRADFARYPRDEERDARLAEDAGVDFLFAPAAAELYAPGFRTWVEPNEEGLEAEFRPGHFRAVATICRKHFNRVRPHRA
jgi:pantoate--beta-alanine ligase